MIRHALSLLLALSLLALAPAGCGKKNALSGIFVLPSAPVVAKGARQLLLATAVFSDGMLVPAWMRVTWVSTDPSVATVDTNGVLTGVNVGTAVITATDMSHPNITASVTVSVTELSALRVTPVIASIGTGTTQQFIATGEYTSATPSSWSTSTTWPFVDMTTLVSWASSSTEVATVGNTLGTYGLATAGTVTGTTTITATELVTRITGTSVSGTAILIVTP